MRAVTADVTVPHGAVEALGTSFGGHAWGQVVTVLSDSIVARITFAGWTPEEMVDDLRSRAGTDDIHLVLDVEAEE
jgi:hypothetical protein